MPESTEGTPATTAAPQPQTPPESQGTQAAPGTSAQAAATSEESISLSQAKKLRKENKALRQAKLEAEEKARKLEEGQLSDVEKRDARIKELEARAANATKDAQATLIRSSVLIAAQKAGLVDPSIAVRLIDSDDVKYDDEGMPRNADKLVRELLEERPYLKGAVATTSNPATPPPSTGATTNPPTQDPSDPNHPGSSHIKDFADYKARKEQIWADLRAGRLS